MDRKRNVPLFLCIKIKSGVDVAHKFTKRREISRARNATMSSGKRKARALRDAAGDNDPHGIDAALENAQDFEGVLNSGDFVGKTALHWAAGRGRVEAVRHLLKLGAKIKTADNLQTPLHALAESGAEGAFVLVEELVLAAPWVLRATDMMQNTALDRARYVKNKEMVRAILSMYGSEEGAVPGVANEAESSAAAVAPKKRGYFSTMFFGKSKDDEDGSVNFSLLNKDRGDGVRV